jgi:hypothetical protein
MDIKSVHEAQASVRDFNGKDWTAKQYVEFALHGRGSRTIHEKFYLAPETCPARSVIVGTEFIQKWGHVHRLFYDDPQRDEMLVLVQESYTVQCCYLPMVLWGLTQS